MKKLLTILILIVSIGCYGQLTKKDNLQWYAPKPMMSLSDSHISFVDTIPVAIGHGIISWYANVDSTIKPIIIQRQDSSYFIIETKNGIIDRYYESDTLPHYQYNWIIYKQFNASKKKQPYRSYEFTFEAMHIEDNLRFKK